MPTLPNGKPLQCKKLPQPDGSTVVIEETGTLDMGEGQAVQLDGLDAMHYRTDGSLVGIVNDGFDRARPALNQQQLVALVTDRDFNLD